MKKYILCSIVFITLIHDCYAFSKSRIQPALIQSYIISPDRRQLTESTIMDTVSQDMYKKLILKNNSVTSVKKISFFKRISYIRSLKKNSRQISTLDDEFSQADTKAQTSLILGIFALVLAIIPFFTIVLAIPLGITALVMGKKAKKMGTKKMTGIGFAIAALIIVAIWGGIAAAYVLLY
jgi:hypothetical protein